MGVTEERSKAESMFKKIMAGNFLNQGKKQTVHTVQEAQRV